MEKLFGLKENNTSVKTELVAGLTTFLTMAYILVVNPQILSNTGMDQGGVFTATAIAAAIGTLVMAFAANYPFALAPGMGLNAFFAFTVVITMGYSWQFALTAVFLEGIIFLILTLFNIREAIVNAIPRNVKRAISVGIGLFIAFIGLQNAGLVVNSDATLVTIGNLMSSKVLLAVIGLVIIGILLAFRVKGALLIGIVAATVIGLPLGITSSPSGGWAPPSLSKVFAQFDFSQVFTIDMLVVLFTFLFVDLFDTIGTLIGVSTKAGFLDEEGRLPRAKPALFADAIATTAGAVLGTSTVTTYVESASGVAEGGRTGLTAFTVAILFLLALFLSPLFLMVPGAATAPALVLVGLFMMTPIKEIDFDDYTESIPAFLAIIMMPLAYSIADGIMFGILGFVLLKLFSGRGKEVTILTYIIAVIFILKWISG
jgi:AGZA family xanthine/uracil permease-like MFS transporter